jgi:hypothetical protein
LIGDVLGIDDAVVAIDHKNGPLEETPLFEPDHIVLAELLTMLSKERLVEVRLGSSQKSIISP